MTFNNFEKEFVLAAELFGDGNMILCNSEMKILALLHSIEVRHRRLAVGLQYGPPPSNSLNVFGMDRDGFGRTAGAEVESVRWMGKSWISQKVCRGGLPQGRDRSQKAGRLPVPTEMDGLFDTNKPAGPGCGFGKPQSRDCQGGWRSGRGGREGEAGGRKGESGSGGAPEVYPVEITAPVGGRAEPVPSFMDGLDRSLRRAYLMPAGAVRSDETSKKIRQYRSQLEEQAGAIQTVRHRADRIAGVAKAVTGLVSEGILSIEDPRVAGAAKTVRRRADHRQGCAAHRGAGREDQDRPPGPRCNAIASALFNEAKKQSGAVPTITEQVQRNRKK